MFSLTLALTLGMTPLPGILAFRLLPIVGFVAISTKHALPVRLLVPFLYAPIAVLAARSGATPFHWLLLAYLYFAGAGWVAHELLGYARSNIAWFAVVALLFWVLPSALVHPSPRTFFVLGWDFTLAAYSYGVNTRGTDDRPLGDFLFFLLVNPSLFYRNRGRRVGPPAVDGKGLLRVCLGVLAMFLSAGPIKVGSAIALASLRGHGWATAVLGSLILGASRLCREYAAQSGVASIQIGCMRQIGYGLPERYRYPLLAHSPADFWRRWNTYVGGWARAYVFIPLMRAVQRTWGAGRAVFRLAYAVVVLLTFAVVGILHDAFVVSTERRWSASMTLWFLVMGIVVVVWDALARHVSRAYPSRARWHVEQIVFLMAACFAASRLP